MKLLRLNLLAGLPAIHSLSFAAESLDVAVATNAAVARRFVEFSAAPAAHAIIEKSGYLMP